MEFAFWLPILMLLVSGIIDLGWYISRYNNVVRAAKDGARYGATIIEDQDVVTGTQIEASAADQAALVLEGLGMDCDAGCSIDAVYDVSSDRAAVVVTVTYPFEPLIGFTGVGTSISAQFTMMAQQQLW
jgi:Flp pilus assembly protein TadG